MSQPDAGSTEPPRSTKVLLVSGWQNVNIGDVAHTPGALRALRDFAGHEVVLWPRKLGPRERSMLTARFPGLRILADARDTDGLTEEVEQAFRWADVCVHSSGPSIVGWEQIDSWRAETGKPYGFFGVTIDPLAPYGTTLERSGRIIRSIDGPLLERAARERLEQAAFVWCRDSLTVEFLRGQGVRCEFGPDAAVVNDIGGQAQAGRTLADHQLRDGEFLCVVPRLRYTPYHELRGDGRSADEIRRDAINAGWVDDDLRTLREVVRQWLRRTSQDVLIVPEMSYAVELAARELADWPDGLAQRVRLLPYFWELDEAASIYRRASAVLSMECHSPLIAMAVGTPALYLRQSTDTIKGQIYDDLGVGERMHELDGADPAVISQHLQALCSPEGRRDTERAASGAASRLRRMAQGVSVATPVAT